MRFLQIRTYSVDPGKLPTLMTVDRAMSSVSPAYLD